MKKTFILNFLLFFCGNLLIAQSTQLRGWYIGKNIINTSASTTATKNNTPAYAASWVSNSMYDNDGRLMFYIADNNLYNSDNVLMGTLGTGVPRAELVTFPAPNFDVCNPKYWVVKATETCTCTPPSGPIELFEVNLNANSGSGSVSVIATIDDINSISPTALAISKEVSGNRYLFMASVEGLKRATINASGVSGLTTISISGLASNNFIASEMDYNPAENRLAWASYDGDATDPSFFSIQLNSSYNYVAGSVKSYVIAGSTETYRGLEFAAGTSNELYMANGYNGISYVDVSTTNAPTLISGTSGYKSSMLELGANGKIYAAGSTSLMEINTSTHTTTTTSVSNSMPKLIGTNFYTLPDQIDGYDYNSEVNRFWFNAINYNTPASATWTSTSNPFIATNIGTTLPLIKIRNTLNVVAAHTLNLNGIEIAFHTGATLPIQNTAVLNVNSSILRAGNYPCALMWQGIIMNGTSGRVNFLNTYNTSVYSELHDAIIGIDATGTSARIDVKSNSLFEANETHIKISNGNAANTIVNCRFFHYVGLNDQTKGTLIGGIRFGTNSIVVENTTASNQQIIGDVNSANPKNIFDKGQYAVKILNSEVKIVNNTMKNLYQYYIWADGASSSSPKTVIVDGNTFDNSQYLLANVQGADIRFKQHAMFQRNTFTSINRHGIAFLCNPGCDLIVGDNSNSALGNTFNYQNWTAIIAIDNANTNTDILIGYNTISNASYAYGIGVYETTLASSKSYNSLRVTHNTISNNADPIALSNINGTNMANNYFDNNYTPMQSAKDPGLYTFVIDNNTINFSTAFNANVKGINVDNSPQIRALLNNVQTPSYTTWGNVGIRFINAPRSLIHANTVKAALGIDVAFNMSSANVYCNTVLEPIIGINLGSCALRAAGYTHGDATESRFNDIGTPQSSWGAYKMQDYYSDPVLNKWVSPGLNITDADIYYSGYSPSIISGIVGPSCGYTPPPIITAQENSYNAKQGATSINPKLLWWQKYHESKTDNSVNVNLQSNPEIAVFNSIEDKIAQGNSNISNEMALLQTSDEYQLNMYNVMQTYITCKNNNSWATIDSSDLAKVAIKQTLNGGPAVTSARVLLKYYFNASFSDSVLPKPSIKNASDNIRLMGGAKTSRTYGNGANVYPNPANNTVSLLNVLKGSSYKITDIKGDIINQGIYNNEIEISNLANGIYFISILDGENINLNFKFVKQ